MTLLFLVMAALTVLTAAGVVCFRNSIHSALCLIANLVVIAALFASLDAHFLATVQIIVYAGAIMVLFVFLIMLLNIKTEAAKPQGLFFWISGVISGVAFLALIIPPLNDAFKVFPEPRSSLDGSVLAMGQLLYRDYVFPFEAASVLILAAIVGAVMLAKRKTKGAAYGSR